MAVSAHVRARVRGSAVIDPTGRYRYSLVRAWDDGLPRACFCLLNPSTADARRDDPTLRRCAGFARAWGFGSIEVVNAFAFRATDPRALRAAADPVGPGNDRAILRAARRASIVVVGWGNAGALEGRSDAVRRLLSGFDARTLGLTKQEEPRHPLYVARNTAPVALGAPSGQGRGG